MSKAGKRYRRFSPSVIIQHLILTVSTLLLIITGLPLKFYTTGWAIFLMKLLGGTTMARELHHLAALMLIFVGLFHLGFIFFTKTGRKDFKDFLPAKKDFFDFKDQFLYLFGRRKQNAQFGRFSYIEKFDYWAVYWGFVVMIGSGLVMWVYQAKLNPLFLGEIKLNFLPDFTNYYIHAISRELHSDEALLATLAIIVWHFYNVIFNPDVFPVNKSIFNGHMTHEEMERDHPAELKEIQSKENKSVAPSENEKSIREDKILEEKTKKVEEINEIQEPLKKEIIEKSAEEKTDFPEDKQPEDKQEEENDLKSDLNSGEIHNKEN